jgi:hypothetical protein
MPTALSRASNHRGETLDKVAVEGQYLKYSSFDAILPFADAEIFKWLIRSRTQSFKPITLHGF